MEPQSMDLEPSKQQYTHMNGKWSIIDTMRRSQGPKARFNHISFIHKNNLHIHGGTSIPITQLDDQALILHQINLQTCKWQKLITNAPDKFELQVLSSHCCVINKNDVIIFGGSNSLGQCKNDLLSLNLESLKWKKLDQKGKIPSPRQSANMILLKDIIFMYGGINFNDVQIYNDLYTYNLSNKAWTQCLGNYQYLIQSRSVTSLCEQNGKIYLFGGQYLSSNGQSHFLNDFYQISISTKGYITSSEIIRLITSNNPPPRSGHSIISLRNNYLALLGGQNYYSKDINTNVQTKNNIYVRNDVWIYYIPERQWFKIQPEGQFFKYRTAFSANVLDNKIYVFGGLKNYEHIYDDLMHLDIEFQKLDEFVRQTKKNTLNQCRLCYQKQNTIEWPYIVEAQFLQQILSLIQFPFCAIGLILDNSITLTNNNTSPISITLSLIQSSKTLRYLKFQDNCKAWPTSQLINSILYFQAGINFNAQGIDKRMKHIITKQNQRKQFGTNLKLGALRLGDCFLYISVHQEDEVRILLVKKQPIKGTQRFQYSCYFYAEDYQNSSILPGYSEKIKNFVDTQYREYIITALQKKNIKNVLYVFNLKNIVNEEGEIQPQLSPHFFQNDITYGQKKKIYLLQRIGYSIYECVDVSLRAYVAYLYLKTQSIKINLSVRQFEKKQIHSQLFLQKIDKMVKARQIFDLQGVIENDCKIVELYYNPDLRRKVNGFHNGILIYHKNRLITRYKYKLGNLLNIKHENYLNALNFINLFGFIQLPDIIPINIYKTDFIYNIMLEKFYSRLKFIEEYLKRKNEQSANELKNLVKSMQKQPDQHIMWYSNSIKNLKQKNRILNSSQCQQNSLQKKEKQRIEQVEIYDKSEQKKEQIIEDSKQIEVEDKK